MKKIILVTLLSFFISSVSYSNSKDIVISKPLNINSAVILQCVEINQKSNELFYYIIVHKDKNPGIVLWSVSPKDINTQILLTSNLFFNKNENRFIIYHNVGGGILARYSYLFKDIDGSLQNKKKFTMSRTILRPLDEANRSFKLFEDGKILEGRTLAEIASLSRPFSKEELKKIENYSNSLKDLFEKQEAKFKKTNEKVMDKLGEKIIQYAELECNSPDVRALKNN